MTDPISELFGKVTSKAEWQRTMKQLEAEGLVELVGYRRGEPAYRITEKGRQQVRDRRR